MAEAPGSLQQTQQLQALRELLIEERMSRREEQLKMRAALEKEAQERKEQAFQAEIEKRRWNDFIHQLG